MTISEISERFSMSTDTLRYYERIGLIPPIKRNKSGIREYSEEDCLWINFAKCMRSAGLPVETLIEYLSLFQQGEQTAPARKAILIEQRDLLAVRLSEMQETLEKLNSKIENYEKVLMPIENNLKPNQ